MNCSEMNCSEMTDFEINCEVLALMEPDVAHMQLSADQKSFFHCGYDGNGFYETTIPEYCSSWADAGTVIQSNQISLDAIYDGGPRWLSFAGDDGEFRHTDTNPLRAAMIVFLMMRETENDK
ncbi:MAG: hypothetical protein [Caudoviricetes sp.]|nr:MAG: hypothetical protein [Caudoviricetes sp.]